MLVKEVRYRLSQKDAKEGWYEFEHLFLTKEAAILSMRAICRANNDDRDCQSFLNETDFRLEKVTREVDVEEIKL